MSISIAKRSFNEANETMINQILAPSLINKNELNKIKSVVLYPNFLYKNKIVGLYAKSGQGKTNLVLGLCNDLLKSNKLIKQVIYINADNGLDTFSERGVKSFPKSFKLCNFTDKPEEIQQTLNSLTETNLKDTLIVLDSLQDCLNGGNIADFKTMKPFMATLIKLRDTAKATIIFLCHTTKQSDRENLEEFNGHSSIKNSSDIFYYVDRIDDIKDSNSTLKYLLKTQKCRFNVTDQLLNIEIPSFKLTFLNDDYRNSLNDDELYFYDTLLEVLLEQETPINQRELIDLSLKRAKNSLKNAEFCRKMGLKKAINLAKKFAENSDKIIVSKGDKNATLYTATHTCQTCQTCQTAQNRAFQSSVFKCPIQGETRNLKVFQKPLKWCLASELPNLPNRT